MQNAPREHSAILSSIIKLPFVFKTFVLSFFEWPLKTGFTVCAEMTSLHTVLSKLAACTHKVNEGSIYFNQGSIQNLNLKLYRSVFKVWSCPFAKSIGP